MTHKTKIEVENIKGYFFSKIKDSLAEVSDKWEVYKEIIWNKQELKQFCGHNVAGKSKAWRSSSHIAENCMGTVSCNSLPARHCQEDPISGLRDSNSFRGWDFHSPVGDPGWLLCQLDTKLESYGQREPQQRMLPSYWPIGKIRGHILD